MADQRLNLVEQRASVIESASNLNKDFAAGYLRGMVDQRDADQKVVDALTKRAEAAEAVLEVFPNILRGIPVRDLDERVAHWEQAKEKHDAVN